MRHFLPAPQLGLARREAGAVQPRRAPRDLVGRALANCPFACSESRCGSGVRSSVTACAHRALAPGLAAAHGIEKAPRSTKGETMRKLAPFAIAAALAWMLVVAAQAPAISRGVPDGDGHPMVAALGGTTPEGVFRYCGAVLVSETVLVTAAHCVAPGARPPGVELRVDFGNNATLNDPGWFAPVAEVASPQFLTGSQGETGFGRSSDIGVVLLAP